MKTILLLILITSLSAFGQDSRNVRTLEFREEPDTKKPTSIQGATRTAFVTNVVESAFAPGTVHPGSPAVAEQIYAAEGEKQGVVDKWITTTIEKHERFEFQWQGKPQVATSITLVSSNTVHRRLKKEERWIPVK